MEVLLTLRLKHGHSARSETESQNPLLIAPATTRRVTDGGAGWRLGIMDPATQTRSFCAERSGVAESTPYGPCDSNTVILREAKRSRRIHFLWTLRLRAGWRTRAALSYGVPITASGMTIQKHMYLN